MIEGMRDGFIIMLLLILTSIMTDGCWGGRKLLVVVDGVEHTYQWGLRK